MTVVEEGDGLSKKGGCGAEICSGVPSPPQEVAVVGYMLGENGFPRGGISRWRFM